MEAKEFKTYKKSIYRVIKDPFVRTALKRAVTSFRKNRDSALAEFPYVEEEKEKLRKTKDFVLENLDEFVGKTMERVEKMHGHAWYAETVEDALHILKEIVGSGKTIVKGKSITSEEIELNKYLQEWGNEVYETDLGEFIIQNLKQKPMHILAPAINVPREKVAELFSKLANRELPPDPAKLTQFAREFLREKFTKADIGITGANVITSDTGTVFLIENEGNIRFSTSAPPVHIVIVGIEKILPTLKDGMSFVEVVSRYAGYKAMTYVSMISGPSKTGDIEKVTVYGAHGPKEFHVIFLDNGRKKAAIDPLMRQFLRCMRCGACMYECPVYPITTGHWGYRYMGGIGIPWTAFISGGLEKAAPMAFTCTLCGRCVKYCPMGIDVPRMVLKIREMLKEQGLLPAYIREMAERVVNNRVPY